MFNDLETPTKISQQNIYNTYCDNYDSIHYLFVEFELNWLQQAYRALNDLDKYNILVFLYKENFVELSEIFKVKSLNEFYINPRFELDKINIIQISQKLRLSKETARRKVNNLIRTKVLQKNRNYIFWSPPQHDKESYNSVVDRQINQISKLVQTISVHLNFKISKDKISSELKKHFSFFWYHYLSTQLKYLRMWQKELNDLELIVSRGTPIDRSTFFN